MTQHVTLPLLPPFSPTVLVPTLTLTRAPRPTRHLPPLLPILHTLSSHKALSHRSPNPPDTDADADADDDFGSTQAVDSEEDEVVCACACPTKDCGLRIPRAVLVGSKRKKMFERCRDGEGEFEEGREHKRGKVD